MAAITWKNVNGNSGEGVATMLAGAQEGFNAGFDKLAGTLKDYQTGQKAAWDYGKQANVNAFQDRLASFKTAEELEAAQASGELDAMKASYGEQFDSAAVRGAEAAMLDTLRNRGIQTFQHQKTLQAQQDDPVLAQLKGELLAINPTNLQGLSGAYDGLRQRAQSLFAEGKLSADGLNTYLKEEDLRKEFKEDDLQGDLTFQNGQKTFANQQTAYAQQQAEYALTQNNRTQHEQGLALINQAIKEDRPEHEIRQMLLSSNIKPGIAYELSGQLPALYGQAHKLTDEQTARVAAEIEPVQAETEQKIAAENHALQTLKERHPVNPVYAFGEKERVSEGKAISQFVKDYNISDWDKQDGVQDTWREFRKERNLPDDKDFGPLLQEALTRTGSDGGNWWNTKNDVDGLALKAALDEVYPEYVRSEKNFDLIEKSYSATQGKLAELQNKLKDHSNQVLNKYKNENKFRNFTRGQ